jgi:hypothetical protein
LVERLNGIEEVRGSNPLGSMWFGIKDLQKRKMRLSTVSLNEVEGVATCLSMRAAATLFVEGRQQIANP